MALWTSSGNGKPSGLAWTPGQNAPTTGLPVWASEATIQPGTFSPVSCSTQVVVGQICGARLGINPRIRSFDAR